METINKCIDIIWHTSLLKNPYLKSRTLRHRHATTPNHVQIPKFLTRIVAFIANSTTKYHKSKPQRQPIANSYPTREKPRKGKKSMVLRISLKSKSKAININHPSSWLQISTTNKHKNSNHPIVPQPPYSLSHIAPQRIETAPPSCNTPILIRVKCTLIYCPSMWGWVLRA